MGQGQCAAIVHKWQIALSEMLTW